MTRYFLACVLACPAAIWAQDIKPMDIKPGLWETTATSEISGLATPQMPQLTPDQLAKMPPEARARIEGMMKGGAGAPRTTTTKSCLTSEQLSKPLFDNGDKSCAYKLSRSSSSAQQIHMDCTRGNTKMAGDMTIDRLDSEHYKGNMVMKASGDGSTSGAPQNLNMKISFSNKWLSSDCGDVKPTTIDK